MVNQAGRLTWRLASATKRDMTSAAFGGRLLRSYHRTKSRWIPWTRYFACISSTALSMYDLTAAFDGSRYSESLPSTVLSRHPRFANSSIREGVALVAVKHSIQAWTRIPLPFAASRHALS